MSEKTWKVEDDELWVYNPIGLFAWRRIGKLEDLAAKEALDLPACTVDQALEFAGVLMNSALNDVISVLFPEVSENCLDDTDDYLRALALALRALSDRLLEVS